MKITVLTGAGISAESGIETFRDIKDGLWYNYDVDEVATLWGWTKNPGKVLEFHNMLRNKSRDIKPNAAHIALKVLEDKHDVTIVTQNVDDLHEKAGSTNILHLHGELFKARDSFDNIIPLDGDLNLGDLDEYDEQLRPHTVFFGEMPYNFEEAHVAMAESDVLLIIGTSFSIQYLPMMVSYCPDTADVYYIDPKPDKVIHKIGFPKLHIIREAATTGVIKAINEILDETL